VAIDQEGCVRRWISVIVVAGLVVAACGSGDSESGDDADTTTTAAAEETTTTTAAAEETTTTAAAAETPVEVAQAVIDTWNSGDVIAFFGWFAEGATIQGDSTETAGMYSDLGFYMGLEQAVVVEECTPSDDTKVTCTTQTSDELSGPLGVETPITWVLEVADGMVASLQFVFPPASQPDLFVVANDAVLWVRDTHPEVFDETFRGTLCVPHSWNAYPDLWCSSPEGAAELLRLGDEFRAQYGA
jgi:hypothetical protein